MNTQKELELMDNELKIRKALIECLKERLLHEQEIIKKLQEDLE